MNLRGVRESGTAFAIPTYAFMLAHLRHGRLRAVPDRARRRRCRPRARDWEIVAGGHLHRARAGLPGARAFSSGRTALTGVEAISNGVPAFRKPKSKNAATTLLLLGGIAMTMFAAITWLAHLHRREGRREGRRPHRRCPRGRTRRPSSPRSPRRSSATSRSAFLVAARHRADPGAGRQHRVQRLPGARLDPGPGRLPAPPAAHPRRPAGVQQRHPHARRRWRSSWW